MTHCYECGTKLVPRELDGEGIVPYCPKCEKYRFPIFSTAMSTTLLSPDRTKALLIQQYGKPRNVLVAGYVSKGENAEHAVVREVQEEMGLKVTEMAFVRSTYFSPTNTLMLHYLTIVDSEDLNGITSEVDKAQWFSLEEAKKQVLTPSLAQTFLFEALKRLERKEIVLLPADTKNLWPVETV